MANFAETIVEEFNALNKGVINFHITSAALYPNAFNQVLLVTYRHNGESFDAYTNVLDESILLDDIAYDEVRCVSRVDSFQDGSIVRDVYIHLACDKNRRKVFSDIKA